MKYVYLEPLNLAQRIARATYLRISDAAVDMFRDLGGFENLPDSFDVSGESWLEAEAAIDAAAKALEIEKTSRLCKEYERRALAYFSAWRKKLEAKQ